MNTSGLVFVLLFGLEPGLGLLTWAQQLARSWAHALLLSRSIRGCSIEDFGGDCLVSTEPRGTSLVLLNFERVHDSGTICCSRGVWTLKRRFVRTAVAPCYSPALFASSHMGAGVACLRTSYAAFVFGSVSSASRGVCHGPWRPARHLAGHNTRPHVWDERSR